MFTPDQIAEAKKSITDELEDRAKLKMPVDEGLVLANNMLTEYAKIVKEDSE